MMFEFVRELRAMTFVSSTFSIKSKVSTLKRNFEGDVSKWVDFKKASFHDEAVGLFNTIIKNCE